MSAQNGTGPDLEARLAALDERATRVGSMTDEEYQQYKADREVEAERRAAEREAQYAEIDRGFEKVRQTITGLERENAQLKRENKRMSIFLIVMGLWMALYGAIETLTSWGVI